MKRPRDRDDVSTLSWHFIIKAGTLLNVETRGRLTMGSYLVTRPRIINIVGTPLVGWRGVECLRLCGTNGGVPIAIYLTFITVDFAGKKNFELLVFGPPGLSLSATSLFKYLYVNDNLMG